MKISLIAAMSENHVIGFKERLPWGSMPKDWENLFIVTKDCKMIMGRKSYDSKDRISSKVGNYVISRQRNLKLDEGFKLAENLNEAIQDCKNEKEIFIIGGGEIFKDAIFLADCIHLTVIHAEFEGDAFFPEIDSEKFKIKSKLKFKKDESHAFDYSFLIYEKA
jgi:dihydrofolate reductase